MTKVLAITPDEAAEKLSVSRSSIYRAIKAGDIPTIRIGRRLLVPVRALEALVEAAA